jgi:hypothetical protein
LYGTLSNALADGRGSGASKPRKRTRSSLRGSTKSAYASARAHCEGRCERCLANELAYAAGCRIQQGRVQRLGVLQVLIRFETDEVSSVAHEIGHALASASERAIEPLRRLDSRIPRSDLERATASAGIGNVCGLSLAGSG